MNRGTRNPLALGLVIVGAAAMAIAAFLPLDEPTGAFRSVESNSLIQQGGWLLIALAIGIAASGFRASQTGGNLWRLPALICVFAAWRVVSWGTDNDMRTLYPIGPNGTPNTSQPGVVASLGIALYVAGVGVALALIGSVMLRQTEQSGDAEDPLVAAWEQERKTKKCPDCAETILAEAKVCKHCGNRFAPAPQDAAAAPAASIRTKEKPTPLKTTKVKCNKCHHIQPVPRDLALLVCDECGARLKRRTAPFEDH